MTSNKTIHNKSDLLDIVQHAVATGKRVHLTVYHAGREVARGNSIKLEYAQGPQDGSIRFTAKPETNQYTFYPHGLISATLYGNDGISLEVIEG